MITGTKQTYKQTSTTTKHRREEARLGEPRRLSGAPPVGPRLRAEATAPPPAPSAAAAVETKS